MTGYRTSDGNNNNKTESNMKIRWDKTTDENIPSPLKYRIF